MLLRELVTTSTGLRETRSRKRKSALLAECLRALSVRAIFERSQGKP